MSVSIQTNINSLVAQQNLSVTNKFQSNTIAQLTSGYRINSSGDDAAGLAVANKFRNAISELTQGVSNGNDAVAQLQIMDGGMSNISTMLDRLKTLAMQSASATFSGGDTGRAQLNTEFQKDLAEIDRQAQSIGLNTAGTFAKSLQVYLGAGSGSQSSSNAVVSVDLSKSTVDTQSLGLQQYQAANTGYDLGSTSTSSVQTIVGLGGNTTSAGGTANFTFYGAGFANNAAGVNAGVTIAVNLSGVGDTTSLATAVNAAIQQSASGASGAAAAFKNANISASITTDATGKQQLAFSSSKSSFTVDAVDLMANALMGNVTGATGQGLATNVAKSTITANGGYMIGNKVAAGNTEADYTWTVLGALGSQEIAISANDSSGVAHGLTVKTAIATETDLATTLAKINSDLQSSNDSTLQQITAVADGTGAKVNFISSLPGFSVTAATSAVSGGLVSTVTGHAGQGVTLSAVQVGSGGAADISTITGAQAAVTAITKAVTTLGTAQAQIGIGQNQLGYAVSLAQSQITNYSAAESQIRDTNVAAQAANLSKASTLSQASIAAMAQANSATQGVLALLRG